MASLEYVLIPGMHRSGTSLTGQLLECLGYSVGKSPMPGHASNPEGFYENIEIVKFHDEILARARSSWGDVHCFPAEWWTPEVVAELFAKLEALLEAEFEGRQRRVIKDPRLCRLLPLWQYYFAKTPTARVRYLLPLRAPWEVARSLQVRDGTSLPLGLFLWTQHVLAAEQATRGCPRLLFTYETMLNGQAAAALASFLDMQAEDVVTCLARIAKPSLRHQRQERSQAEGSHPISPLAEQAWALLAAAGQGQDLDQAGLDALWQRYVSLQQVVPADFDGCSVVQNSAMRQSSLFLDYGLGFNARDTVTTWLEWREDAFDLRFELPKADQPLCNLRWDPIENACCRVAVDEVITNAGPLTAVALNADDRELGMEVFRILDPMYALRGDLTKVEWVSVRGRLVLIPALEVVAHLLNERVAPAMAVSDELALQQFKELRKQVQALQQNEAAHRRAVERWNQRSWFTRAFHRLRLKHSGATSKMDSPKKNELGHPPLQQAQHAAQQAVVHLQNVRCRWLGRLLVRSARLRAVNRPLRKAEQALQRSHPEQALALWLEAAQQCVQVLEGIGAQPLGRWVVRSQQLRKAGKLADKVRLAQARWLRDSKAKSLPPPPTQALPLFDAAYYLAKYPDVAAAGIDPLTHYREHGWKEGRNPMPLFDVAWYLRQNPDIAATGVEPFGHYLEHGWRNGRAPHPQFDAAWYLRTYPDVAAAQISPLLHYVRYGAQEGRCPQRGLAPSISVPSAPRKIAAAERKPSVKLNPEGFTVIFIAGQESPQLIGVAGQLAVLGHAVHVCLPEGFVTQTSSSRFHGCTWQEALEKPERFASTSGKRVIHAWSLQDDARTFAGQLQAQLQCPVFAHHTGSTAQQPASSSEQSFLEAAAGVTYEIDSSSLPASQPSLRFLPTPNPELFRATPRLLAERRRHNIADHETVVAYTGRVTTANRGAVASLCEAVKLLRQQGFPLRLLHAGTDAVSLFDQTSTELDGAVIALGQLPHAQVPKILGMADFFVLPNSDQDHRITAQLGECLSIGRPTLLPPSTLDPWPRDGVHAILLRDGSAGEIADRLSKLIPDFEQCEALSLGSLAFAREHLDGARSMAELIGFYEQAIA